ncbi:MAG: hypothetical protein ACYDBQ_07165 [Thermoplasmatota archaeon]
MALRPAPVRRVALLLWAPLVLAGCLAGHAPALAPVPVQPGANQGTPSGAALGGAPGGLLPAATPPTTSPAAGAALSSPYLQLGDSLRGTIGITGNPAGEPLVETVVAVNETHLVGQTDYVTYRIAITTSRPIATEWLRASDLALLEVKVNASAPPGLPPFSPGSTNTFDPPCGILWPLAAGASWNSNCQGVLQPDGRQNATHAFQSISYRVDMAGGKLVLREGGTLTYPGRPDSTFHYVQDSTYTGLGCLPSMITRSDSTGTAQTLEGPAC